MAAAADDDDDGDARWTWTHTRMPETTPLALVTSFRIRVFPPPTPEFIHSVNLRWSLQRVRMTESKSSSSAFIASVTVMASMQ